MDSLILEKDNSWVSLCLGCLEETIWDLGPSLPGRLVPLTHTDNCQSPMFIFSNKTRTWIVPILWWHWGKGDPSKWEVLHPAAGGGRDVLLHVAFHKGPKIQGMGLAGCGGKRADSKLRLVFCIWDANVKFFTHVLDYVFSQLQVMIIINLNNCNVFIWELQYICIVGGCICVICNCTLWGWTIHKYSTFVPPFPLTFVHWTFVYRLLIVYWVITECVVFGVVVNTL